MARNKLLAYLVLYPISMCYGIGVATRNWMFNHGFLSVHEFDIPVISVGNIAVGGTGKTPHTEYIVSHLKDKFKIAILSRGYKRDTRGFVVANNSTATFEIGDEPMQMYRKFGNDVTVAVCEKRVEGIDRLLELDNKINMIVLDDAFQHRYVKPAVSIVLTDYARPVYNDHILPYGRLREPVSALNRADIVIVTKCPSSIRPMDMRLVKQHLNLYPYQKLYFSTYEYGQPLPVFPDCNMTFTSMRNLTSSDSVLSLTGIDNPKPFVKYLRSFKAKVKLARYSDHHTFTEDDMSVIERKYDNMTGKRKIIITTEKDAVRIQAGGIFPERLKKALFYVPIKVKILDPDKQSSLEETIQQIIKDKGL